MPQRRVLIYFLLLTAFIPWQSIALCGSRQCAQKALVQHRCCGPQERWEALECCCSSTVPAEVRAKSPLPERASPFGLLALAVRVSAAERLREPGRARWVAQTPADSPLQQRVRLLL
jgi:hypothetical protein